MVELFWTWWQLNEVKDIKAEGENLAYDRPPVINLRNTDDDDDDDDDDGNIFK